jgi:hypothetical protein
VGEGQAGTSALLRGLLIHASNRGRHRKARHQLESACALRFLEGEEMLQSLTSDTAPQRGETWLRADLLFLRDALARGMSYAEVAGFLGRPEEEVRQKAEELD